MLRFLTTIVITSCISLSAMSDDKPKREEGHDPHFGDTQEYFEKHIKPLVAGVGRAKKITLHEGLPHQFWERKLLAEELKNKKTVKLDGFPFYDAPIMPGKEAAKKLAALCSDLKSFERWEGPKLCGGYHPDWCIEFKDGDVVYRVSICFGCHEARISGPKNRVSSDLDDKVSKALKEVLPAAKNRPMRECERIPEPEK